MRHPILFENIWILLCYYDEKHHVCIFMYFHRNDMTNENQIITDHHILIAMYHL